MNSLLGICIIVLLSATSGFAQIIGPVNHPTLTGFQDSLQAKIQFQYSTDSLKIKSWSESLKSTISEKFSTDSLNYQSKIDSLRNLDLSLDQYALRLDSLSAKKDHLINEVNGKKDQLLSQTKGRLEIWRSDVQAKLNATSLIDKVNNNKLTNGISDATNKVNGLGQNVPGLNGNIPDVSSKLPNLDTNLGNINSKIPSLDSNIPNLNSDMLPTGDPAGEGLPEMPALSMPELKGLDLSPDLSSINEKLSLDGLDKFGGVQERIGGATEQIGALKNISSNPDAAAEVALKNVEQFGAVQEKLGGVDAIKDNQFVQAAEKMKDPDAMKEEIKQVAIEKAIDHFAGKEAVVQEAMAKISKYKSRYGNVGSLNDIKKLPKNSMKGKPFRERIIPGVMFQFLHGDDLFLDINPYAYYRITGRLGSGFGWNQRIGYALDKSHFTSTSVVYGPRFFTEVKGWKGFIARAEFETMNTQVPPSLMVRQADSKQREWVPSAFIGIKKDYRFFKRIKGTTLLMFNVYNHHRKSPYSDVVNARFGFEFPLKKKPKTKEH